MLPSIDSLIATIERTNPNDPLAQLGRASGVADDLSSLGETLRTHFVGRCRDSGCSWTDIGAALSVSRQAVQKRFTEEQTRASPTPREFDVREHGGKYRPLWAWLREQRTSRVAMSFTEIEKILGFSLPPSSRKHQPHWHSYDGSAVVRAIVDAGWRAERVNLAAETVVFVRRDDARHS